MSEHLQLYPKINYLKPGTGHSAGVMFYGADTVVAKGKNLCSLFVCGRFQQVCEDVGRSDGSGLFARMTRHNSAWAGLGVIACNRLRG